MSRILQSILSVFIFFVSVVSFGQNGYCGQENLHKNGETPYDSVYFENMMNAYVNAVNHKNIKILNPYLLSEQEFKDIIEFNRRYFPQCLSTMDTTYKSVTFMTIYNKFIERDITINKLTVVESRSSFSCSNGELKKIYCDINFNKGDINNGMSRIILLTAKTLSGDFKIGIEVCESKLFTND
jgi:hypothetical protein